MNLDRSRWIFRSVVVLVLFFTLLIFGVFFYLMLKRPDIVPQTDTFASFWIKNFSILIAALAFAASALSSAHNALEERHLRFMENYPYLEVFPILSVDPLPLPVPRSDLPKELENFNTDYLRDVAPSQDAEPSSIEFRYCAIVLRNVGNGVVTRATIKGSAEVPSRGVPPIDFEVDRRVNLSPGSTVPFTILPISGLPEYLIHIDSLRYYGHFVELNEFDGSTEIDGKHPYSIPVEQREALLDEDFVAPPAGQGWMLDFWGQWQPTNYIKVPQPSQDEHYLLLSGDDHLFASVPHYQNQAGAYKDLRQVFTYGQTVEVTARVRSIPGTSASLQLWCHDLAPNPKNRYTDPLTPGSDWQEIRMLYTSTQTPNLRVHLLYTPGVGEIHVDSVRVEGLYT